MTKKHFIELADAIKNFQGTIDEFTLIQVEELAQFCKLQNDNFNSERWLGYIAGTCGQNGGIV